MSHALITHFKQISQLSESSEDALHARIHTQSIPKNQDLQQIGQTCKTLYFLKTGLARIYYFHDGNDVT